VRTQVGIVGPGSDTSLAQNYTGLPDPIDWPYR
jgi:hypothetical protein